MKFEQRKKMYLDKIHSYEKLKPMIEAAAANKIVKKRPKRLNFSLVVFFVAFHFHYSHGHVEFGSIQLCLFFIGDFLFIVWNLFSPVELIASSKKKTHTHTIVPYFRLVPIAFSWFLGM